ncbi:MAG TPA: class I tRNA ligase family protein, partial [Ktedonobacterales bacterium]
RGTAIWTKDALDEFGVDALRYYLAAAAPETRDTDFIYDELIRRNNDELVAAYGNAAHRVLTFTQRHFEGKVPEPGPTRPQDTAMLAEVASGFAAAADAIEAVRLRDGLQEAMRVAREANRYLDEQAPWKAIKGDRVSAATTVHTMIQVLNGLKVLFAPYLPHSSQKLHELLGFTGDVSQLPWTPEPVPSGQALPVPAPLFAKLEPRVEQAAGV